MWVERSAQGDRVFVDGHPHEMFDEWLPRSAFYSPTGGRIGYVATRKGAAHVVVDGVPGPPFDNISKQARPLFSPDSRHYAYGGIRRGRGVLVLDGQVRDEDALAPVAPVFSPDSCHFAYAVESQKQASAKQWVIQDETAEPAVDRLIQFGDEGDALVFSPDGLHLAYAGVRDGSSRMYVDTQPGPAFVVLGRPAFSPDSRRMAYMGGRSDQARSLVVDGVPGPEYNEVGPPTFSPDSRRVAYFAAHIERKLLRTRRDSRLILDGLETPLRAENFGELWLFSPDSAHFVCWAYADKGWRLQVDGKLEDDSFDGIGGLIYSTNGRLASAARHAHRWQVRVDATTDSEHDDVRMGGFSPDGSRFAYLARDDDSWRVVVDGSPGPGFAAIDERYAVTFSHDGAHFAYVAQKSSGQLVPVLDHEAGPEGTGWAPALEPAGRIWFLGATPESLLRWDWTGTQTDVYGRP